MTIELMMVFHEGSSLGARAHVLGRRRPMCCGAPIRGALIVIMLLCFVWWYSFYVWGGIFCIFWSKAGAFHT